MIKSNDINLENNWNQLMVKIKLTIGKKPADLNSVLFLIGIHELGKGFLNFSKEEKQDLMHIATCKLLSFYDIYSLEGKDESGWPIWKLEKKVPKMSLKEQENLLKYLALKYFEDEVKL